MMFKIAAYIASRKLEQLKRERDEEKSRSVELRRSADFAGYGDNGTEGAFYLLTNNFR